MPNDAKLGLVVGVGVVIAAAVLFFHKDAPTASPAGDAAPAGIVRPIPPALPTEPPPSAAVRRTARTMDPAGPDQNP
ncbi:MAG TPA: hypothetical protein VMS17_11790 [Gemmataceae bacterium]|nr:hypothetical protein [Gemmataceae bacterium]